MSADVDSDHLADSQEIVIIKLCLGEFTAHTSTRPTWQMEVSKGQGNEYSYLTWFTVEFECVVEFVGGCQV